MQCSFGQGFGGNYSPLYAQLGLRGHPGVDVSCGWDSPIEAFYEGSVRTVWTPDNTPARDGTTLVEILVDNTVELFIWQIGHCLPLVRPGEVVRSGTIIGREQNHGPVYAGNIPITLAMQKAGDQRGHHRHYQKRPLRPDTYTPWAPGNGYNGCIDPTASVFQRDLWTGSQGYDVFVLQRLLKKCGFFAYPTCTGYFGTATIAAVRNFQRANGITPTIGYFGPKTRAVADALMPPLFVPPATV